LLSEGFGFEISKTRHAFAEKFKQYVGSTKVKNLKANVFEINPPANMDLVLGVDIVFQLFGPLFPKASDKIIKWFHKALKKDGRLIVIDESHAGSRLLCHRDGDLYQVQSGNPHHICRV
jgi:hypothetical protein